jgi:N6-L-threonylcarbamoyladenine synthase
MHDHQHDAHTPPPRTPINTILALETSCDETAAAVIRDGKTILANVVASQMEMHQRYGGIVPEVASRQHILSLVPVLQEALGAVEGGWGAIDAVASTYGPGLSGALLTGLNAAKAIAWQRGLPFIGVNHLEAHIYANWLTPEPTGKADSAQPNGEITFPVVALIVSGGHTMLTLLTDHGAYQLSGQTRDDAAGEAFDKVARILDLGYPGGPVIERAARDVTTCPLRLPRAWLRDTYDFSFSGLKTAVLHTVQSQRSSAVLPPPTPAGTEGSKPISPFAKQVAYAFQESVVDVLATKTIRAAEEFGAAEIVLAGGVAANTRLREELHRRSGIPVRCPPLSLCTDNAAMVGAAAYYRSQQGISHPLDLDVEPNLRLRSTS